MMYIVVAFSSSLDITAVQMECVFTRPLDVVRQTLDFRKFAIRYRKPLDYNQELITVGISNVMSGLGGGFTGSYIISRSAISIFVAIF